MEKKKSSKPKGTRLADDRRRNLPKTDESAVLSQRLAEEDEELVEREAEDPRDEEPGEVP